VPGVEGALGEPQEATGWFVEGAVAEGIQVGVDGRETRQDAAGQGREGGRGRGTKLIRPEGEVCGRPLCE